MQPCTIEKSSERTAKVVGVSARKVSQARTTLSDPEVAQEVEAGKISINKGAQTVKAKKKPTPTTEAYHHRSG